MHDFKIFLDMNDDSMVFHAKIKNKDKYEILHDFHNLYLSLFEDIVQGNMNYKYVVNKDYISGKDTSFKKFSIDGKDAIESLTKFKEEYEKFHSFIVYFEKETA